MTFSQMKKLKSIPKLQSMNKQRYKGKHKKVTNFYQFLSKI